MAKDNRIHMGKPTGIRWMLVFYDLLIYTAVWLLLFVVYKGEKLELSASLAQYAVCGIILFAARIVLNVYRQIWRYGGIQSYILLLMSDCISFLLYYPTEQLLPIEAISFVKCLAMVCMTLLGSITIRMIYRYAYKCCNRNNKWGRFLFALLRIFGASDVTPNPIPDVQRIKIAIFGAGTVGTALAEELLSDRSPYLPICFIDNNKSKIGRRVHGLPVYADDSEIEAVLNDHFVQEVVFALPQSVDEDRMALYNRFRDWGYKIKVYDYPTMDPVGKRSVREFDIEELLFRKPIVMENERKRIFYGGKVVMITGGGGSIGSELCRQIAKLSPKRLVIFDVYENGAYEIQQELRMAYGGNLDVKVEIASICDKEALRRAFVAHKPNIVIMAAAHKHVPLMEKNCIEAIRNNVFGTLNTVEVSEEFNAERVIMVSTDKAVNPTNVMGATKRMCEMIVRAHSVSGTATTFSMTRFGNVLGSAGSVIPLFKKQIAHGGPITITDKRIIRYFMTIPEASQLVLESGAMAKNGELFVLDMGNPIRIYDLAENMIKLTGARNIDIVETGLRPGEKLYEELLVKTETLTKTDNELIFIEDDTPITMEELSDKLRILSAACDSGSDSFAKAKLREVVPSFKKPEEINSREETLKRVSV